MVFVDSLQYGGRTASRTKYELLSMIRHTSRQAYYSGRQFGKSTFPKVLQSYYDRCTCSLLLF